MATSFWFKHILNSLSTIASSQVIKRIQLWHWVDEKEHSTLPSLWEELDNILDKPQFRPCTQVDVACARLKDGKWEGLENFNHSQEIPSLLPKLHARGALTWPSF